MSISLLNRAVTWLWKVIVTSSVAWMFVMVVLVSSSVDLMDCVVPLSALICAMAASSLPVAQPTPPVIWPMS